MPFDGPLGDRLRKMLFVVLVLLSLFLVAQSFTALEELRYVGTGIKPTNTIMVSGHGEMSSVPDIATFTFSIVADKATVANAQTEATAKANAALAYIKSAGVADKDIQTSGYSINPQYEYQNAVCPTPQNIQAGESPSGSISYCPPGRQVIKGYEVRQSTTLKVRDTKKAGELLAGVGEKGATEVSGLQFTFDDPTGVQEQARNKAIIEAKKKADILARQLGVSLVRVVAFAENGSSPMPMMAYNLAADSKAGQAPQISTGENKLQSDVSITYEIR